MAAAATAALLVSIEIGAGVSLTSRSMTGATRSSSSSAKPVGCKAVRFRRRCPECQLHRDELNRVLTAFGVAPFATI
jgi:hypothetical protein